MRVITVSGLPWRWSPCPCRGRARALRRDGERRDERDGGQHGGDQACGGAAAVPHAISSSIERSARTCYPRAERTQPPRWQHSQAHDAPASRYIVRCNLWYSCTRYSQARARADRPQARAASAQRRRLRAIRHADRDDRPAPRRQELPARLGTHRPPRRQLPRRRAERGGPARPARPRRPARLLPGNPPLFLPELGRRADVPRRPGERRPAACSCSTSSSTSEAAQPALPSIIQRDWDRWQRERVPITLVLSRQRPELMEGLLTYSAPLYGRATQRPLLDAARLPRRGRLRPQHSPEALLRRYAVLGGTPQYQMWAGDRGARADRARGDPHEGAAALRRAAPPAARRRRHPRPRHLPRDPARDRGWGDDVQRDRPAGGRADRQPRARLERLEELGYVIPVHAARARRAASGVRATASTTPTSASSSATSARTAAASSAGARPRSLARCSQISTT